MNKLMMTIIAFQFSWQPGTLFIGLSLLSYILHTQKQEEKKQIILKQLHELEKLSEEK